MRSYTVYQDVLTRNIYGIGTDGELTALSGAIQPYIFYKETIQIRHQLLNGVDTTDVYTGLAGLTISASAAVDNNFTHYYTAAVSGAYTGAITAIVVTGLTGYTPTRTGRLLLINAANESESVDYTSWTLVGTTYTFAVSKTLTYTYANADVCRVSDTPIIKTTTVDLTNQATGLLIYTLNARTEPYQNKASTSSEIKDCKFEAQIIESAIPILVAQFEMKCFNLLDDDAALPPIADDNYYNRTEVDSLLTAYLTQTSADARYVLLLATDTVTITNNATTTLELGDGDDYLGFDVTLIPRYNANTGWIDLKVRHNGSDAFFIEQGDYGAFDGYLTIAAEYDSMGVVSLLLTLTGYTDDILAVYAINKFYSNPS